MRKPLPSRDAVVDVLRSAEGAVHARDVAERLHVGDESFDGLLRLLDSLVFDGLASARGQHFMLHDDRADKQGSAKRPAPKEMPGFSVAGSKPLKGLPPKRGFDATRKGSDAPKKGFDAPKNELSPSRTEDARGGRSSYREERITRRGGSSARERREGTLNVNPRGFGFVASPVAAGDDVFIGPDAMGGAMHGDTVIIDIIGRGGRGAEGQIVEITKRAATRVSGILRRRGKSAWIEPDDPRMRGPIVLTREIDATGPEGNSGVDGQVAICEVTRFPEEPGENPEGKLLAILGAPGELSVEVRKVLFVGGVEELHSPQAVEEAEAYGIEVPAEMLAGREDLTHLPLPTIDPEDARDHDDAVWVDRNDRGGYEVWVAIADVSSYVRPGTNVDAEAHKRGCSIYLPDRAIPMLPRALSSNLCSLLPDVLRLCLCVHAELDSKGAIKSTRLVRGFMKSQAKLTYGGVARALGFTDKPPRDPKAEDMLDGLRVAYECSRLLRGRRMKRGALDFNLPEAKITLDADGKPVAIKKRADDAGVKKAYELIEELMIFANEVVARWLLDNELPGVYRVHLPPDPKKLERLTAMCEILGIELDIEDTQTPKGLADILKSFADHPQSAVLNNLLLRSLKQASYDTSNLGHFGLASEAYLHFTSPIRRYPDLVVHRVVHAASDKENRARRLKVAGDAEALAQAALHSSQAERRAMEIEREISDIYRCFYMIGRMGERFEGTISAFVGSGAFVAIDDPFVDVMIRTEDMGGDFVIDDDGLTATSKRSGQSLRLGDRLLVEIMDVAILRRSVYARRVRGEGEEAGADRPPTRGDVGRKHTRSAQKGGFPGKDRFGKKDKRSSDTRGSETRGGGTGAGGKKGKTSKGKKSKKSKR